MLSDREQEVVAWYDMHAHQWANQRKKSSEPSFWAHEYEVFHSLKKPCGKLLEIGCGSGREALEWIQSGYEYVGIDNSKKLVELAKLTAPTGSYFQSSVYEMPFEKNTFEAVSSWSMLPHVPKERIEEALKAIRRVLKPEGLGFIAMREGRGERQEENTGRWFSYYLQEEFAKILKDCGFEVLQQDKKFSRMDLTWLTFFVKVV